MILGFGDLGTKDIYNGVNSKAARQTLPRQLWKVAQRKLDYLKRAMTASDLASPPGNNFEALKGALDGKCSIRINDQFRIVFAFTHGNASEVQIIDYHRRSTHVANPSPAYLARRDDSRGISQARPDDPG